MMNSKANYDFSQRTAVVTGGSSGIGLDIAQRLLAAGASVTVWDLKAPPPALQQQGMQFISVDVCDIRSVQDACDAVVARSGQIDMLVNCAGFAGSTLPLEETDPQEWQRVISINLLGVYNTCRAAVPVMKQAQAARIVNIASLAGKEGTPNASAYSAAKAGVLALTKSLGKELAQTQMRVNAIAPAAINTTLLQQMSPAHVQTMIDKSPMKRLGECEEVSELTLWLLSASCSFSTGAVFDLSGGRATY
ncbi:SDR family NAD(P)-dependent oxidoreductase [Advenella mimigardefordensis]|uniref:Putative 3-oxoacyl-[acyl-carrier-protein] reductase FabG n=1 Tax=Advenella mimigardefordensis (strain DSM 17166 / LMG 22922 / DPN7) TaxID=1247726 RepID=W0PFK3_ADVMD|nr:SDR family NAD(P)-dependent oxidoreductase [Advenella mimigardefordensis]AHG65779.1 putative 3-oxoacyl-[acyl-carrier-protein] reductase FabG [Advenella mimigardefordensis DPN7]